MSSRVISQELRESADRKGISQVTLSKGTFRAKTTVNGYFRGDPTPVEAIEDIAHYMDDSLFSQDMSHQVFNAIPPMQSDVFRDCPHTLDILQLLETEERKARKNRAMFALAKNKKALNEQDKEDVLDYALNFLDEVFIETRCIISILEKIDMSLMHAVNKRIPHWKAQNYMKGE